MYKEVSDSRGIRRSFTISCSLQEGYGSTGHTHTVQEAINVCLDWMEDRCERGLPFLTGTISTGEVAYAWPDGPGKAFRGHEPVAIFSGEVTPLYMKDIIDQEITEILNDLASYLGQAFNQTRLYISFGNRTWILQKDTAETPTGEKV